MGRNAKDIDSGVLFDLLEKGLTKKEAAEMVSVSPPTLSKRIAQLQMEQGLLMKYRELQSLQLTGLQARILEAITPEKIESATIDELCRAYKILKDKELVSEGKPNEITGLVGYLVQLEKQEVEQKVVDVSPEVLEQLAEEVEKEIEEVNLPLRTERTENETAVENGLPKL